MSAFAQHLIAWHARAGRHKLPWQASRDPYRVWLSEIMLQQTQVDVVIPYYARFLARFPTLADLAAASQDEVLGLWSGLGYYARARNLHRAAQVVMSEQGGVFPRSAAAIAELPGVGRSTAAAVAAFSYGERGAILDGNVKRVLCRVFAIDGFPGERAVEQRLWTLAESLLPEDGIGTYIQAQMDLGATICTRGRPACHACPLAEICEARFQGRVAELPAPRPRKALPEREARVLVLRRQGRVLLERRPPAGLWGGLLCFPEIPEAVEDIAAWATNKHGAEGSLQPLTPFSHTFTHLQLQLFPWLLDAAASLPVAAEPALEWLDLAARQDAALPLPVRRVLDSLAANDLFSSPT